MDAFREVVTTQQPVSMKPIGSGKSGALLATFRHGIRAVVKVSKDRLPNGHLRQRGIAVETHPQREVAFYRLAHALGYSEIVPETVLSLSISPQHVASAQQFIQAHHLRELEPALKDVHSSTWMETLAQTTRVVPKRYWKQLLVLDFIAGSRDRHANNVGMRIEFDHDRPLYRLVAWDNAVCFGETFDRYHNVFHKTLFRRSVDLSDCWSAVDKVTPAFLDSLLGDLLTPVEIQHAALRAQFMREYPHRLPWKVCSKGHDSPHEFPHYRDYFESPTDRPMHLARISA